MIVSVTDRYEQRHGEVSEVEDVRERNDSISLVRVEVFVEGLGRNRNNFSSRDYSKELADRAIFASVGHEKQRDNHTHRRILVLDRQLSPHRLFVSGMGTWHSVSM